MNTGFCKNCHNAIAYTGDVEPKDVQWSHISDGTENPCCDTPVPEYHPASTDPNAARELRFQLAVRLRDACQQEAGLCYATPWEMQWLQFAWEELDRQLEYDHLLTTGLSDYEARETVWPNTPATPRHPKELNQQPNLEKEQSTR